MLYTSQVILLHRQCCRILFSEYRRRHDVDVDVDVGGQIVPKRLHKGVVVSTILRKQRERVGRSPDFVLCIGDDANDEQMFSAVYSFLAQAEQQTG